MAEAPHKQNFSTNRCDVCNRNFPLHGTTCVPCQRGPQQISDASPVQTITTTNYENNNNQAQVQNQGQEHHPPESEPGPDPGCGPDTEDAPELRLLEAAWRAGKLQPVPIQLGELPPHAGPVMRHIAEHLRLRMGLRLAVGDDRPLPYALSEAVNAGLATDKAAASRALAALVRARVIDHVGALQGRRGLDGTKLYAPPAAPTVIHGTWEKAA